MLATGCGKSASAPDGPRVVIVCVEALRHDYPERLALPTLERMSREGARATRLVPVFPANSLPNVMSIATGAEPTRHGFINNIYFDRTGRYEFKGDPEQFDDYQRVQPIWAAAVRSGIPTATVNWAATEVAFDGVSVSRVAELDDDAGDERRVDEVIKWIEEDGPDAPRLILAYLDELDDVSHDHGPDAPQTLNAATRVDGSLGRILDAIDRTGGAEGTTLIVLADHGMANVSECIYLQAYLRGLGFTAMTFSSGATSNVYLQEGTDAAAVKTALEAQDRAYHVYLPDEVPEAYGNNVPGRMGDLVMVGKPGTYFRDRGGRSNPVGPARLPGMHGYPADNADMMGVLFAWGRGVPAGQRWEDPSVLDIHPTVCALLGITPEGERDGMRLTGVSAPAATAATTAP